MEQITLKLEGFSGPLSLLYHLIEKNKIDIYNIPIAEVTSQYMAVLEDARSRNMEIMSEFILMAASLVEIKSRMLLPKASSDEPEEDPREELVRKLIEYKRFVAIAEKLKEREKIGSLVLYKKPDKLISEIRKQEDKDIEKFLNGVTMEALLKAFEDVCRKKEDRKDNVRSDFNGVKRDQFTVEDKIKYLRDLLYVTPKVIFSEIFRQDTLRIEIAVTFLALLQLLKDRYIEIYQESIFGNIIIVRNMESEINEN